MANIHKVKYNHKNIFNEHKISHKEKKGNKTMQEEKKINSKKENKPNSRFSVNKLYTGIKR